jgi:hypothetical protein
MGADEVPLLAEVREALDGGHPLELLGLVSMVILATAAAPLALERDADETPPSIGELIASFIDMQMPETTALLAALGEMLPEGDTLIGRSRQAVAEHRDSVPPWLAHLDQTTVHRAARMTHALDTGEELVLGVRFADGQEMTCMVNIDHAKRSPINDAFFVPNSIDTVLTAAKAANTDPDMTFEDIGPADARAGLVEALSQPLSMVALRDSDTWPGCRALVQWVSRLMPRR